MRSFSVATITVLLGCVALARSKSASSPTPSPDEQRIFYLLNQEREQAGVPKLEWNEAAAQAARAHAHLLANHGELSHQFPGEPALRDRLIATTVRFTSAAENVAKADEADEAHLALMYSSGHRENILNKDYTAAGIGVVQRDGKLYVAQDFIRLVPVYGEEAFRRAFVKAFNHAREAKALKPLLAVTDPALREAACSSHGIAALLPAKAGFSGELVVFSLSDPQQLPAAVIERAQSPGLQQMSVGVCFRPDAEHGNGNFWVVAALAR